MHLLSKSSALALPPCLKERTHGQKTVKKYSLFFPKIFCPPQKSARLLCPIPKKKFHNFCPGSISFFLSQTHTHTHTPHTSTHTHTHTHTFKYTHIHTHTHTHTHITTPITTPITQHPSHNTHHIITFRMECVFLLACVRSRDYHSHLRCSEQYWTTQMAKKVPKRTLMAQKVGGPKVERQFNFSLDLFLFSFSYKLSFVLSFFLSFFLLSFPPTKGRAKGKKHKKPVV